MNESGDVYKTVQRRGYLDDTFQLKSEGGFFYKKIKCKRMISILCNNAIL
jgi:hypothetical protein